MIQQPVRSRAGRPRAGRTLLGVTAVALALATAGCSATAPAPTSDPDGGPAPATVVIATPTAPGTPGGVPIWIGQQNGYFEDENLTVEVITFPGQPAQAVAAVSAGQADLVISAPAALIVPTAEGTDLGLKWVFTPYQAPTFVVAVAEDSPIESMADLAGKTVAMPAAGAPYESFLRSNVSGDGGDPSGIRIVAIASTAAIEQLAQGAIDAVVLSNTDLAQAEVAGGYETRKLELAPNVKKQFGAGFMMRSDATEEQKDAYARYLRAYLKSALFALENPEAAVRISWDLYPASVPTDVSEEDALAAATAALVAQVGSFEPSEAGIWGEITQERWEFYIDSLGLAAKIPDVTVLYDDSLLPTIGDFDAEQVAEDAANYDG